MTRRRPRISFAAAAAVAAMVSLSACGTATIEDAVPVSASGQVAAGDQPPAAAVQPPADSSTAVADTTAQQPAAPFARPGDYPNLNVVPVPAAAQITAEEKDADFTMLQSIRAQQEAETRAARQDAKSSAEELRRLARKHAAETLKEIQSE